MSRVKRICVKCKSKSRGGSWLQGQGFKKVQSVKRVKSKICSKVKRGGWMTKYKVRGGRGGVAKSKW